MDIRLVPKSVILNDPEWRNNIFCIITVKVLDFKAKCIKTICDKNAAQRI